MLLGEQELIIITMKTILLLLPFIVLLNAEQYNFTTKYIDVPLDHFSFTTNTTFKLRYLVNDEYFFGEKPIYFYTGNEGDVSMFAQNTGFMFDLAHTTGALIVFAEHRFYGTSLPFGNESYVSPKNLGYLSAQQALADYVYLIDYLQTEYAKNSTLTKLPVIAFGGSYGGMLAAWLRMKYPSNVLGAIASSAPIWQFQGLTPCENFYKIATDVIRNVGSKQCEETLKKSWAIIRNLTSTDQGKVTVSSIFNLCKPLSSVIDIEVMMEWLQNIYVNIVMVNYPYPTSFLMPLPGNPVYEFCQQVDLNHPENGDEDLLKAVVKGLSIYTNYTGATKCNNIKQSASDDLGMKGWVFQSCTDMVMPMCSTDDDLFENTPWDFEDYSNRCYATFSVRPRSERVPILEFGGKNIETASNIVFSNGLLDPWSSGGVFRNISPEIVSILIPSGAHHIDLRSENELDKDDVKFARTFHAQQINIWLDKFYDQNLPLEDYFNKVVSV